MDQLAGTEKRSPVKLTERHDDEKADEGPGVSTTALGERVKV
jgi:hypothetical protein